MSSTQFYVLIAGFIGGVLVKTLFLERVDFLLPLGVVVFLLCFLYLMFLSNRKKLWWVLIFLACFLLGLFRYDFYVARQDRVELGDFFDRKVEMVGEMVDMPDRRIDSTRYEVYVESLMYEGKEYEVGTKMLVISARWPEYLYGDTIRFTGYIQEPKNFIGETGREFDYVSYLALSEVFYLVYNPEIEVVYSGGGSFIHRTLYGFSDSMEEAVSKYLSTPELGLLLGEVFGKKAGLGALVERDFRRVGLVHIVVLSGYNVSLVVCVIVGLLSTLSAALAVGLSVGGIVLFAILVGGGATVVRASLMAGILLLAKYYGSRYMVARALCLAGVIMVWLNPLVLVYDISFQLSFMATMGIIYVVPVLNSYGGSLAEKKWFSDLLVPTVATQIAVLPILLYYMGEVSIISPLANILVLPVVPVAMLLGFLLGLFEMIFSGFSYLLSFLVYPVFKYQIVVAEFLSSLPFAVVSFPPVPFWFCVLLYGLIAGWVVFEVRRKKLA